MIKVIDMDETQPEESKNDFRDNLAALIQTNSTKKHPNLKLLGTISAKLLKVTDELAQIRISYMRLHNIKEDKSEDTPYDINAVQLGITYAIHECHKIIANMDAELQKAKNDN